MKSPTDFNLKEDLLAILTATLPETAYTHNSADKHDTHIGVTIAALQAMRELPKDRRPKKVIGCEVWRALDWLPDDEKVLMDVSGRDNLAAATKPRRGTLKAIAWNSLSGLTLARRTPILAPSRRALPSGLFEYRPCGTTTGPAGCPGLP